MLVMKQKWYIAAITEILVLSLLNYGGILYLKNNFKASSKFKFSKQYKF